MEADFSGYATKAGLKCSDGRTIMAEAFRHQDKAQVPLVWQHGHTDPENVLGHAILESREDGVYAYGFFNDSTKATHAKKLLVHKDINMLSIWANELIERAGRVLHGAIREVSLVLSGANPGALIENVTIRHSDDTETTLDEEAIIYTGLTLQHDDDAGTGVDDGDGTSGADDTIQDVIDTMSEKQQEVLHYMIGEALKATSGTAGHGNTGDSTDTSKGKEMKHNVFEQKDGKGGTDTLDPKYALSHADVQGIVADAMKNGSLKAAVENYALAHGIESIDLLFPEARLLNNTPEFLSRRVEWVAGVLGGVHKSPFSRIKTIVADITFEEARAKGYIKGNLKKEEFFAVSRRVTTPQTIYKKQKIDRDDMIDITDFDVVTWLKGEMRLMLDEELAGAILIGDGREADDDDKIKDIHIRPILTDDPFYTVQVNVDLNDAASSIQEVLDAMLINRQYYKGTGTPTMYTTETWLSQALLLRDNMGRKLYPTMAELVTDLRVKEIIPVEIMNRVPDVVAILVNLADYNVGADKGGEVNLFDFFDIDYNQQKYLIETRCSGALTRPRSAMVFRATGAGETAATATAPAWDAATYTVTLPVDANVNYVNATTGAALADGDHVLAAGDVLNVRAVATAGHFLTNVRTTWSFLRPTGS